MLLDIPTSLDGQRLAIGQRSDGLTLGRLRQLALSGAGILKALEAQSVAFIGINSAAFPVTLYAAAAAGIPVAPLNYRLSAGQLRRMLSQLPSPVVVADPSVVDMLGQLDWPTLPMKDWLTRCGTEPVVEPADVDDERPAVLLFTSGTTSAPKCVILRHSNLQSYVLATADPMSAAPRDTALIAVPPYHVAGVGTVLTNVFTGRRMVYLPNFTAKTWLSTVRDEQVTFAMVVPTMLARIVGELEADSVALPHLRSISYGGARMPRSVLERAMRLLPAVDFTNAYGLTETSSTVALLGPDDHRQALSSPDPAVQARLDSAGRLIPGVEAEVRAPNGAVLPSGQIGELWLRGPQVSGEYSTLGSVLDQDGWFPTRDSAHLDSEGYLFVHDRTDDVIIRGGENVSPAEIEDTLLRHPGVEDVAVVGMPDDEWGQRIVAVVVPTGERPDAAHLRAWVRDRLRSSKTPDQILFSDELPYGPTGKLLRTVVAAEVAQSSELADLAEEHGGRQGIR
jgi:acyl-CoA synthetase (AMP-forming)/AMP-acid ligase II